MLQFEEDQVNKGVGMFGQNNNQDNSATIPEQSIDGALSDQPEQTVPPSSPSPATSWQHPGTPLGDSTTSAASVTSPPPTTDAVTAPTVTPPTTDVIDAGANDELIDIKQKALSELAPLVDHLDQSPEERFRTTMMMIQASDNQALVKDAYDAAQGITDEKARAQALLDIINEINYFTQQAA